MKPTHGSAVALQLSPRLDALHLNCPCQQLGRCLVSHSLASKMALRSIHARIRSFEASMFKLIATMRRGSASGFAAACARYPTLAAARIGTATLLRDDR